MIIKMIFGLKEGISNLKGIRSSFRDHEAEVLRRETLKTTLIFLFWQVLESSVKGLCLLRGARIFKANTKDSGFDLTVFLDSDFAGCKIDRKSTTGGCQLLGDKLVSLTSKKQNSVSTSTAEAEYVAAGSCCAQVLWIRNQLLDYGFQLSKIPIYCDNTSAIAIANNPVLHSKTKHIEIRYHFIRDHVMNGDVDLHFVPTEYQLADLFTKPLDEKRFNQLTSELGMLNLDV
ncbi:hypothetical protein OSB04_006858 [Centaurea solstitialis]|uniref:Copia protein n=1 Tax=Centaurea solstitialis TaxID=347529 RepID=A0AA38U3B3_9ASTR|nr:hypothetical protein OSB04_006858 [Centaurea solstitialis]